jgi:hypothetical protein
MTITIKIKAEFRHTCVSGHDIANLLTTIAKDIYENHEMKSVLSIPKKNYVHNNYDVVIGMWEITV